MFINFTNHPLSAWDEKQRQAAENEWGTLYDLPFPEVDPAGNEDYIARMATIYQNQITGLLSKSNEPSHAVHAMGEMNLCFEVVNRLKAMGITCLAATTRRLILFENKGLKSNKFEFVQFRKY